MDVSWQDEIRQELNHSTSDLTSELTREYLLRPRLLAPSIAMAVRRKDVKDEYPAASQTQLPPDHQKRSCIYHSEDAARDLTSRCAAPKRRPSLL